jgi:hypothetical protein
MVAEVNTLTVNVGLTFQSGFLGAKSVYGNAFTAGGLTSGWTALGTWTATNTRELPQAVAVAPASGNGSSQTFRFVYSDPVGVTDLRSLLALVNSSLTGVAGCDLTIDPTQNYLWLLNDSATAWLGPIKLGSAGVVQNSQCTVNGGSSRMTATASTITVDVSLAFQSRFAGTKNIYGNAVNVAGVISVWTGLGTWTVQ